MLLTALVLVAVSGCTSDPAPTSDLPQAKSLLSEASTAFSEVRSATFTLRVNGTIDGISVQSADGELTREGGPAGGAKGTVRLTLMGQLIEGDFVLVNDQLYLKGPTGGFTQYPAALTESIYDPSAILDPERGIAKVLASTVNPKTEAREDVDGTAAYRVSGRADSEVVKQIVPGVTSDVDVTYWLAEEGKHLPLKARVTFPKPENGDAPTVEITLSDLDKPVTVTPPA